MQCGLKGLEDEAPYMHEVDMRMPVVLSEDTGMKMSEQSQPVGEHGQEASSDIDSNPSSWDACEVESGPRLTVMPFLVALIGGGVFSLEEFEAFP